MEISNQINSALDAAVRNTSYQNIIISDWQAVQAKSNMPHDFQSSVCLKKAKSFQKSPLELAEDLVSFLSTQDDFFVSASAPGFLNFTLKNSFISKTLKAYQQFFFTAWSHNANQHIIVDYSSPNIAKELHVGHLRSTIIGDAIANTWEATGAQVTRLNHLGDWGTAFGMLLAYLERHQKNVFDPSLNLSDLMVWYQDAKKEFDENETYYEDSKKALVRLQAGAETDLLVWKRLCEISKVGYQKIYDQLEIHGLQDRGESFYQPWLAQVVQKAQEANLLSYSDGAACIFLEGFTNRDGAPLPLIIQKSDGGFNYATTDLAAVRYRMQIDQADKVFYVTDNGQRDHFAMVFAAAKALNWVQNDNQLIHVPFGVVQNPEKKRYKTRSGSVIRLQDLLDEAYDRAHHLAIERNIADPELFARIVGFGAIKYADLSTYRLMDYVFDFDKMLAFDGNTIVYLLYSLVRAKSILKKAQKELTADYIVADCYDYSPSEKQLVLQLVQLPDVIKNVLSESSPHLLCDYLYALSSRFNHFFRDCPVIGHPCERDRLHLVMLVEKALTRGLKLLGIHTLETM